MPLLSSPCRRIGRCAAGQSLCLAWTGARCGSPNNRARVVVHIVQVRRAQLTRDPGCTAYRLSIPFVQAVARTKGAEWPPPARGQRPHRGGPSGARQAPPVDALHAARRLRRGRGADHRPRRGPLRLGRARQALPRRALGAVLRQRRPRPRRARRGGRARRSRSSTSSRSGATRTRARSSSRRGSPRWPRAT